MDLFASKFEELRRNIAEDNTEELYKMMRLSTERRKYFDEKETEL